MGEIEDRWGNEVMGRSLRWQYWDWEEKVRIVKEGGMFMFYWFIRRDRVEIFVVDVGFIGGLRVGLRGFGSCLDLVGDYIILDY